MMMRLVSFDSIPGRLQRGLAHTGALARGAGERVLYAPSPSDDPRLTMQLADARLMRTISRGNIALIGSTGSGKSTTLEILIASLFRHLPPRELVDVVNGFVFDPQNDLYRPILSMGLPIPVVLTNVFDRRAWAWDLCQDLVSPAAAEQFAFALIPDEKSSGENKFYTEAPRILFASVLRELTNRRITDPRFRWTLREAILLTLEPDYARRIMDGSRDEAVRAALPLISKDQEVTYANLRSSLVTKLRRIATYAALLDRPRNRFTLDELVRGHVLVIVGGDFEFKDVVNPFNQLLLSTLKTKLIGQEKSSRRYHHVIMEEFAAINGDKSAEEVIDFFVRGRSRGVRVVMVIHSPRQLQALYGAEMADVLLGQTQHKVIFKVNDAEGAAYCAKELGFVHGYEWAQSVSVSATFGEHPSSTRGMSASEQRVDYTRVHLDDIKSLPLAGFTSGIWGYGSVTGETAMHRWRFHLDPEWLARHAVAIDPSVPSYESCRRTNPEDQVLLPLSEMERRRFKVM